MGLVLVQKKALLFRVILFIWHMHPNNDQAEYSLFLKGVSLPEFQEIDAHCVPHQLLNDAAGLRTVIPLYYHLTRRNAKEPFAKLKRMFCCGAETISRVRKSIAEKKPLPLPRKRRSVRNDPVLRRLIDQSTLENGHLSDSALSSVLGTSRSTVNKIRHDLKFKYKPLRHGPVLSQRQVAARLMFCRNNIDTDWTYVMFTDESRFSTSPDSPVMWWVKNGHHEYVVSEKFPPSIMVWGGIIGTQKTQLLKCPQRLNAQGYVDLLGNNGIDVFLKGCGPNALFQQDGARCHTAASTMRWFHSRDVNCLPSWPANSPDLSPIEQVWGIMKRFILQWFGMKTPIQVQQLDDAVFEAYNNIEWTTVGILMLSVKHRMRACIDRNGMFIGDLVGECCRRARIEFEGQRDVLLFQVSTNAEETNDSVATNSEQTPNNEHAALEQTPRLPSLLA